MGNVRRFFAYRPGITGAVIVSAFLLGSLMAPMVPHAPHEQNLAHALRPPSSEHWFGTDQFGRDIFSRVLHGGRISLALGAGAVATGISVGMTVGLLSGYIGGPLDALLMRVMDVMLSFPYILLAIVIITLTGPGLVTTAMTIGIVSIPTFARLARASTLSISGEEYVLAAVAVGNRHSRIILRHILPNMVAPMLVQGTFSLATAVLFAGSLSFLGLGVLPPTPEWGAMLSQARGYIRSHPHLMLFPGMSLTLFVIGINLLGDGLRVVFDPRMSRMFGKES